MTEPTAVLMRRTFETAVTASEGDGRTIEARIVPYNVEAIVVDLPPAGDGIPYPEVFVPGAFERQLRAADRVKVWLNFEHEVGLRGIVGHGTELHDGEDGLYGTFRVHENADGDKALSMVRDGLTPEPLP
jgi:phage head maturation protease